MCVRGGVLTCGLGDAGDEQQKQQPMIHGDTWCQQGAVDRKNSVSITWNNPLSSSSSL